MATETIPTTTTTLAGEARDPFFYGWRMVPRWHADGQTWERVPLTAWDVLHPEEDDFIVQTDAHDHDCHYLKDSVEDALAGRAGVDVFTDLRIDWQIPGLNVHGPDIIVFEGLNQLWQRDRGTFPVKDMGARPLLIVEVASPNTRDIDTVAKVIEYHRAGVPVYVIVNRQEIRNRPPLTVYGYQATPGGYELIPDNAHGVWVESVGLWVRAGTDRVVCTDKDGTPVPERPVLLAQRNAEKTRADAEKTRADAEKTRADAAQGRTVFAETARVAESARADENAQKLAALEVELKRLRGDTN